MDNITKEKIYTTYNEKAQNLNIEFELTNIYKNIADIASVKSANLIAATIIAEESSRVNSYIRSLRKKLKELAMDAIVNCGISENLTEIIWANVINAVGLPIVQLCRQEKVQVEDPSPRPNQNRQHRNDARRISTLEKDRNLGIAVAAAGLVSEVVTCLIVPGFGGVAGVLKAAELIIVGGGAYKAVKSQREINQINRIVTNENMKEFARTENDKAKSLVEEICKKQFEINTGIILDWKDKICQELIHQCEIEMQQ